MGCSVLKNHRVNNVILGDVNSGMPCELALCIVIFVALVALEKPFSRVRPHVALQLTRRSASEVTLVTLVWLFSSMVSHHVYFQIARSDAGVLAHCASVRLFPRVGPFVVHQSARFICSIVTLIAWIWFLSSVLHSVLSQTRTSGGYEVALCAFVRFLPSVNEEVGLQMRSLPK